MSSGQTMIELQGLTKRYGKVLANDAVHLSVRQGELLTLLGPSGCGKTTTLRCITGHITPDAGRVLIGGNDVTDVPTYKRNLGMVFQNFALFPHMKVSENVAFPLRVRRVPMAEQRRLVQDALRLVRLEDYMDYYPRQLSGGQQQRVGLARALVYRPSVLLLDEPLSNLDAKLREEMRFEIRDIQRRLGITAVYVTHDQEEALAISDRIAVMNRGRVVQVGAPEEVYSKPASKFVADFVGLSNFIEGVLERVDEQGKGIVTFCGFKAALKMSPGLRAGDTVLMLVRPSDISILPADTDGDQRENTFGAVVEKATYLGDKIDYVVKLDNGVSLRVQAFGTKYRFHRGDSVRIILDTEKCQAITE